MMIAACSTTLFLALVTGLGLVIYAYYSTCDPLAEGRVEKTDQVRSVEGTGWRLEGVGRTCRHVLSRFSQTRICIYSIQEFSG